MILKPQFRVASMALLAAALLLTAPATAQHATHYVSAPSAAEIEAANVLLVDIRRPEEWQQTGVFPGALLMTYDGGDPEAFIEGLRQHLQPGQPVALICRTGNRTSRAAAQFAPLLEQPVVDLAGGMMRLLADGYAPARPTREQGCTIC